MSLPNLSNATACNCSAVQIEKGSAVSEAFTKDITSETGAIHHFQPNKYKLCLVYATTGDASKTFKEISPNVGAVHPRYNMIKTLVFKCFNRGLCFGSHQETTQARIDELKNNLDMVPAYELDNPAFIVDGTSLSHRTILGFFPSRWLTGTGVEFLLNQILLGSKDIKFDADQLTGAKFNASHFNTMLARITKDPSIKKIVLLRNLSEQHWSFYLIDLKLNLLQSVDSLGYLKNGDGIGEMMRLQLETFMETGFQFKMESLVRQEDSHNCGIFTVLSCLCLLKPEATFTQSLEEIGRLRLSIISHIIDKWI